MPEASILKLAPSFTGRRWRWRGGAMDHSGHDPSATPPVINPSDEAQASGVAGLEHNLLDQLLLTRGVPHEDLARQRTPTLRGFLPDPSSFRDMATAAARLAEAVIAREAIAVYGDYDVDGATSAALLIRLLRALGHDATPYIPDRLLEGYGPSGAALLRLGRGGARLIVTVDCGAMAHEALAMAAAEGIAVIVVDHHACAAELPQALALINPNRLDESPEAAAHGHLAAVGVAFLLAVALVRELRARGYFADRPEPDLLALLDLVALGTVADVAALRGVNRALVAQGLKVMARRQNLGLAALIDASGITRAPACADLGFALGPRINAGGRVGAASLGVRLLISEDADAVRAIATELSALNEARRAIEAEVQAAAEAQVSAQHNRAVLVLASQGWHPGVIGIVAGRIKETSGKPCFVIALDESGLGKGSGRSIPGVNLGAAVIAAREAGLLVAGGGHAMAAGLTVAPGGLARFADWLEERLASEVANSAGEGALALDLALAPGGLTPALVAALDAAGPFGMGWPAPRVAVGPLRVVKADRVGVDHVRVIASGLDGARVKAIAFRAANRALGEALLRLPRDRPLWLAGRARIDDWGPRPAAELAIDDAAWAV